MGQSHSTVTRVQKRIKLVDRQSTPQQFHSVEARPPRCSSIYGRIIHRMGGSVQGRKGPRSMDTGAVASQEHQYPGNDGNKIWSNGPPKQGIKHLHKDPDRQQDGSILLNQERRHRGEDNLRHCLGLLALGHIKTDHSYSKPHSRSGKQCGRPRIKGDEGPIGFSVIPRDISKITKSLGTFENRPVCQPLEPTGPKLLCLDETTGGLGDGCSVNSLARDRQLRLPPMDLDPKGNPKNPLSTSGVSFNNSNVAKEKLVQSPNPNVNRIPYPSPGSTKNFKNCQGRSTKARQEVQFGRLESIRNRITSKGISKKIAEIITDKNRKSTRDLYEHHWKQWNSWCNRRGIPALSAPLNEVLNYLNSKFEEGLEVSSIGVIRAAIASTINPIDGYNVGSHPLMIDFFKGLWNRRPKKPKMVSNWNAQQVLNKFIDWGQNKDLDLKHLSWKLAMLMALASAGRCQELSSLDVNCTKNTPEGIIFTLKKHKKNKKCNEKAGLIFISKIEDSREICPIACMEEYISRTSHVRNKEDSNILFRNLINLNLGVSPATISRWITSAIKESGQEVKNSLVGHSARSKSVTIAKIKGLSTREIMQAVEWKSSDTFHSYYYKPNSCFELGNKVLSTSKQVSVNHGV